MSNIKVLGIDLAKDIFQLHGTDAKGTFNSSCFEPIDVIT